MYYIGHNGEEEERKMRRKAQWNLILLHTPYSVFFSCIYKSWWRTWEWKGRNAVDESECGERSGEDLKTVCCMLSVFHSPVSFFVFLPLPQSLSLKQWENIRCWRGETKEETSLTHTHAHTLTHVYFIATQTQTHAKSNMDSTICDIVLCYINKLTHVAEDAPPQTHVLSFFVALFYLVFLSFPCAFINSALRSVSQIASYSPSTLFSLFILIWIFSQNKHSFSSKQSFSTPLSLSMAFVLLHILCLWKAHTGQSSKQITHVQHILWIAILCIVSYSDNHPQRGLGTRYHQWNI